MGSSNSELENDSAIVSDGPNTSTDSDSDSGTQTDEGAGGPCFYEGEKVLAYHSTQFYEAKVTKAEHKSEGWRYFVHYLGWNKHWDEWLGVERLKKHDDENVQKFMPKKLPLDKNAKAVRASQSRAKVGRGKKRKNDSVVKGKGAGPLEKYVSLQLPPMLKKQLIDDCEFITHLGKLVKLPRSPNVDMIMKKYLDYGLKKDDWIYEAVEAIAKGLCCYFNKALPVMLLYKSERAQYSETIKDGISPSAIYGAEHLLRLFVKLPELLIHANIEEETLMELQQKLVDFLKFLQKNQSSFFLSTYHVMEESETSTNREDD